MVKFITSCVIALSIVSKLRASSPYTDHRVPFKNGADVTWHEEFVARVVNISQQYLSLPEILRPTDLGNGLVMPADTPREHLDVFYLNPSKTVAIGILIENYSKYRLGDPRTSGTHACSYNHQRNTLLTVEPGSSEYMVVDNGGYAHHGICGTVSWQIFQENGSPILNDKLGTRFTITYYVPYRGPCGQCSKRRENTFSLNVMRIPLNATHHWTTPNVMEKFWDSYHYKGIGSVHQSGGEPILGLFDKGRYLARGQMECGCKPLLVVQFMPGPDWRKMMWAKNKMLMEALSLSTSSQGTLRTGTGIPFLVIVVGSACTGFLVLVLGFCGIRKCKEARSPGYDSAPIN